MVNLSCACSLYRVHSEYEQATFSIMEGDQLGRRINVVRCRLNQNSGKIVAVQTPPLAQANYELPNTIPTPHETFFQICKRPKKPIYVPRSPSRPSTSQDTSAHGSPSPALKL
jgi:hypothetical protein